MNKLKVTALALAAAALFAASAARASAFDDLTMASGVDVTPLRVQVAAMEQESRHKLMIPRDRKDILAACPEIDAKTFRAWTLPEAVTRLQACLDKTFKGRKYTVTAEQGRFGARSCPDAQQGQTSCGAIIEVEGLVIKAEGVILLGDGALADLDYSLAVRHGKVLGHRAIFENKTALAK